MDSRLKVKECIEGVAKEMRKTNPKFMRKTERDFVLETKRPILFTNSFELLLCVRC